MRLWARVTRIAVIGVVLVGTLVMASTAIASRPPTRGEDKLITYAFRDAHYQSEDGVSVRSIREIRVSVVNDRWAVVLYSKPKRGSKKLSRDYFRRRGDDNWKKGKPPRPVAADLKKPAERYLVEIRYRGSGSFRYDYDGDIEGAQAVGDSHLAADFSWDLGWRGVELYDNHYPGGDDTPDTATAEGTYSYSYEDHSVVGDTYYCIASGPLQSAFEGWVRTDRGHQVAVSVEEPAFAANAAFAEPRCYERDIWRDIVVETPDHQNWPTARGVPMFPTTPIEESVLSDDKCAPTDDPGRTNCTFALSGTVTITPP
jgi:hypothetical protein